MKKQSYSEILLLSLLVICLMLASTLVTTHLREARELPVTPESSIESEVLDETTPEWEPSNPILKYLPFAQLIDEAARASDLDPELLHALVETESTYNADARSPRGARGLTQVLPSTAKSLGVEDVHDPKENLRAGARYLKQQLDRFGTLDLALSAYNAGPTAVRKYRAIPPYKETRKYVPKVIKRYKELKAARN